MKAKFLIAAALVTTLGATAATAARREVTGSFGNATWKAQSSIIGQTPTSDVLPPSNTIGGGNPIYYPGADKSGTVALIMDYGGGSLFICSGSLLNDRRSIATAGHCVSDGAGTANPLTTTAYFFNGDADTRTPFGPGVAIDVSRYYVNPLYTGEVIDQN
ncbi:MAG TPA: hypothetical protein PK808_09285, partial [Polymorphobacter sp.]|nr:hypothetical protein [Polymorphobacter sp.]